MTREDVRAIVAELQAAGFLQGHTVEDVVRLLDAEYGDLAPDQAWLEMVLLAFDEERVWWRDCECDALEGNRQWERWAVELAHHVGLRDVRAQEHWGPGEAGSHRVVVTLCCGRRRRRTRGRDFGDYIDSEAIQRLVNSHLPRWGRRLHSVRTSDQTVYLVLANGREKRVLEARGWSFQVESTRRASRKGESLRRRAREWWEAFWWPFTVGRP